jgi:hypothetical protein
MAEAVTAYDYRLRLARQAHDGTPVKRIFYMAFGDGGHNPDLTPKSPDPNRTTLWNELLRKPLTTVTRDALETTGRGALEEAELVGARVSEAALLDEDGKVVGFKTFAPKLKESDERYEISITLRY